MEGLQRSVSTFRRSGSSGLVWEDRFLSEEFSTGNNQKKTSKEDQEKEGEGEEKEGSVVEFRELRPSHSVGSIGMLQRNSSNGGDIPAAPLPCYRSTGGKVSPAIDPPSPKVSACGFFCGIFSGEPSTTTTITTKGSKQKGNKKKKKKH